MANMQLNQLREHLKSIISNKKAVRRRGAESLKRFLEGNEVDLDELEDSQEFGAAPLALSWSHIIQSLNTYLMEEADCLQIEEREKKTTFQQNKNIAQRTLHTVVRLINKNENSLPAITLLKSIFVSFERPLLKLYFGETLLKVLESAILCKLSVVGSISEKYWLNILQIVKEFPGMDVSSIYMIFKWAALHKMSAFVVREEFPLITRICMSINVEMTRANQENIIKLVLQFTEFTSPDSRFTCCKMSESTFIPLINIYDKSRDVKVQKDLNRLFYIQMILHHTRGSPPPITSPLPSPPSAQSLTCAHSWSDWTRCVRTLFTQVRQRFESECRKQFMFGRRVRTSYYTQTSDGSNSNGSDEASGSDTDGLFEPTLLKLLVEVSRQIFHEDANAFDATLTVGVVDLEYTLPKCKKARVDRSLTGMIESIGLSDTNTDDLPWIAMLDHFLRKYPTAISCRDYETFVIKLSKMQVLENLTTDYINSCLKTLVHIEKYVYSSVIITDIEQQIQEAWKRIWETALRLVGLTKYTDSTHRLLDELIKSKKCSSHADLLKLYFTNVIFVSTSSIRTLRLLYKNYLLEGVNSSTEDCVRRKLIKWILNGSKAFLASSKVAQFLVKITLRQWPIEKEKSNKSSVVQASFEYFEQLENIYELNSFTKLLELQDETAEIEISHANNQYLFIDEVLEELQVNLLQISQAQESTIDNDITSTVNLTILLLSVLSNLIKYKAVDETTLDEYILTESIIKLFEKLSFDVDSTSKKTQCSNLRSLKLLFQLELVESVQRFLKENIPLGLLTVVNKITKLENTKYDFDVQMLALEVFASFAFRGTVEAINQNHAAQTLFNMQFDIKFGQHYEMMKLILSMVTTCNIGQLPNNILTKSIESLQNILNARYSEYEAACFIMNFLHDILPHISNSNSAEVQKECTIILYNFFTNSKNYGPKVSMLVIKCLKQIWKLDPLSSWSMWNNVNEHSKIILNLPSFLKNDYIIVRYVAIDSLVSIFKNNQEFDYDIFNVQKELLNGIIKQSAEIFSIEGDLSPELVLDETATRIATVLHTFASIIVYSPNWRKRFLAEFLKLLQQRQLFSSSTSKLFTLVAIKLHYQSSPEFLQKFETYLLLQWDVMKLSILDFPYALFEYEDLSRLLAKNINITYPILMQRHYRELLKQVCVRIGKSTDEISHVVYPQLRTYYLMVESARQNSNAEHLTASDEQRFELIKASLANTNSSELDPIHIETILFNLLNSIFDLDHLKETYDFEVLKLPKPDGIFMSVQDFKASLDSLKDSLGESSLILYMFTNSPDKLRRILLRLKSNVYEVDNIDEKIVKFHAYAIFSTLVVECLSSKQAAEMREFLVRDFIYTHIHFMVLHKNSPFEYLCIRNFAIILSQLLPSCALQIQEHVSVIVNKCVQIINDDEEHPCFALLDILVLGNWDKLRESLLNIDPYPNKQHFQKYAERIASANHTAEDAIKRFLRGGNESICHNNECRAEGIKSLRNSLASHKEQLFDMYESLLNTRGFSEDGNGSIIHRLLCCLIKYATSKDTKTSLEATRCLGELGARDLTTIMLTSQCFDASIGSSYRHFVHCVISLLIQCQIDEDIQVVIKTNTALEHVLEMLSNIDTEFYYIGGRISKSYLVPFVKNKVIKGRKSSDPSLDQKAYFDNVNKNVWCPMDSVIKYDIWLKDLVISLLKCFTVDSCLKYLIDLIRLKLSFAEKILPVLVDLIITSSSPEVSKDIEVNLNRFFERHAMFNKNAKGVLNMDEITMQKDSVKCMLDVVHFLRLEKMNKRKGFAKFEFNYLEIALAAQYCSAYFTSILYGESWCHEFKSKLDKDKINSQDLSVTTYVPKMTIFEKVYEAASVDQRIILETVFSESYTALGETDAVSCLHLTFLRNRSRKTDALKEITEILTKENCTSEAYSLWYSIEDTMDFDAIYKMCTWDKLDNDQSNRFTRNYLAALKALDYDNKPGFLDEITSCRQLVIEAFQNISLESTKNIYDYLAVLQSVNEMEQIASAHSLENQTDIVTNWQNECLQNLYDFKYLEQIQLQRIMISSILLKKNEGLKPAVLNLHLDLAKMTRDRGWTKQTIAIVRKLRTLPNLSEEDLIRIHFEEVRALWLMEKVAGSSLLQNFLNLYRDNPILYATGLKLYGTWIGEIGALDTQTIIKEYFQKSILVLSNEIETKDTLDMLIEAYDVLSKFADEEYQRIFTYTKSSNFEQKKKGMHKLKAAAKGLENMKTKPERTARIIYSKQSEIDETEIKHTQDQMNYFLKLAMKYYINNLIRSDKYNMRIFRVVSMWLENKSNSDLTEKIKEWLQQVSTYKYLCILPQLIPHIDSVDHFKTAILTILERCALGHPHHTLPIILSMSNANKDDEYTDSQERPKSKRDSSNKSSSSSNSSSYVPDSRVDTAVKLLNKLKKQPKLKEIIPKMISLSDAVIDLAYIPSNKENKMTKVSLPYQSPIRKIKDFDEVALPTVSIPYNVRKEYNCIVGINSFGNEYYTVGGMNQPKRISIRGTDGIIRQTLVKGKDDMRQDAVMQQVFNIMNDLFRNNKETSKLFVRTYKVVPLSKCSGILEWVENANALSMYLQENHERYSSVSLNSCRSKYSRVASKPIEEKLRTFNEICEQLTPVFHRFFVNTFLESAIWYDRRRAYITSVAVSSMCGYVLGVGDRHVTNILIDEKTAEVIHIDFGIAFEQGRVLPTPETVPFRLTREIVDGMGVTGTEGIFRRSCEKTLSILRKNMETIIAILEVLLYDPLYTWTITPQQAYTKQLQEGFDEALPLLDFNDDSVNVTAERVLSRIRDKLIGKNDRTLEGQVLKLINQARDPANLCRLFYGWQPYL